jgi:hypothetical protein
MGFGFKEVRLASAITTAAFLGMNPAICDNIVAPLSGITTSHTIFEIRPYLPVPTEIPTTSKP